MDSVKKLLAYNNYFGRELPVYYVCDAFVVYDDLWTPLAREMRKNIKGENQNTVLVEGPTGTGKSSKALNLCTKLDPKFDLDLDYVYDIRDMKKKLRDKKSSPVSLIDEGSVSLNSLNTMQKDNKKLTILMDSWRVLGKTNVICIPNSGDMNKRVLANHIDYLIKCPARPMVPGEDRRKFCTLFKHEYREWAKDYWRPIGRTKCDKVEKKLWEQYMRVKKEHLEVLIDDFIEEDDE